MHLRIAPFTFALALLTTTAVSAQDAKAGSPASKQRSTATTMRIATIDPAAQREEARRLAPLSAADRAKIVAAARTLRERIERPVARDAKPRPIEVDAREIAAPLSPSGADGDIEALAFLVLMQAAKSAQEDLKSIMAQVKAINAAKGCRTRDCLVAIKPTADYDKATLERIRVRVGDNLDSMSEMGEMESLRLQMAMDRLSKMMSTLSNILKKMSDTASSITQNLK